MNIIEAVRSCFKNYATISGRAARSEFWYWKLFNALVCVAVTIGAPFIAAISAMAAGGSKTSAIVLSTIILLTPMLVFFIPSITVAIRRLHDINRSGWWMLIVLTVIGAIPYVYWCCKKGDFGDNGFGADPLTGHPGCGPRTGADTAKAVAYTCILFIIPIVLGVAMADYMIKNNLIQMQPQAQTLDIGQIYKGMQGQYDSMQVQKAPPAVQPAPAIQKKNDKK